MSERDWMGRTAEDRERLRHTAPPWMIEGAARLANQLGTDPQFNPDWETWVPMTPEDFVPIFKDFLGTPPEPAEEPKLKPIDIPRF